jgi:DNA-binding LytR/AlgR family response regulator
MLMRLRTIIVDDEPMARKGLSEDLRDIDFIELAGVAENSFQALDLLSNLRPDLLLLDIDMPRLSGLDLLKSLPKPPMIIIVTAFSEYALQGFELDVMDYLIKPVDFSRLLKACCKAREFHLLQHPPSESPSLGSPHPDDGYFFVKAGGKYEKLLFRELLFVEAADNYVMIHVPGKKILTYHTLKHMATILPSSRFIKVHKSFIVALDKVRVIEGQSLIIDGFTIPVSRQMKDAVRERILGKLR